jgi:hypothetical protein
MSQLSIASCDQIMQDLYEDFQECPTADQGIFLYLCI